MLSLAKFNSWLPLGSAKRPEWPEPIFLWCGMTAPLLCICLSLLFVSWHVAIASGNVSGVNGTVALPDGAVRLWLDAGFFSDGELSILKDIATTSSNRLVSIVSQGPSALLLAAPAARVRHAPPCKWIHDVTLQLSTC